MTMANYDDIFNASAQKGTEDKSFVSFNKEEWAAQKKQERESAFAMIDETAQHMANDGMSTALAATAMPSFEARNPLRVENWAIFSHLPESSVKPK